MTINPEMKATVVRGRVVLGCRNCNKGRPVDAQSDEILKVCSFCGAPLGEWGTTQERDREIRKYRANARLHAARRKKAGQRKRTRKR
jgi:hypothetical protein